MKTEMVPEPILVRAWGATATGESRTINEDSYLLLPVAGRSDAVLAAVADGMGGHRAGEVASRLALEALSGYLSDVEGGPRAKTVRGILRGAIDEANRAVLQAASSRPEWSGMGTTLTAVLTTGLQFSICHVGDSRAYWYSPHFSDLVVLTRDHSLAAETAGEDATGGILTRALGVSDALQSDFTEGVARPGDRLLLCTDGITRVLGRDDLDSRVGRGAPEEIPSALVREARERGSRDDITAVLLTWLGTGEEENVDR